MTGGRDTPVVQSLHPHRHCMTAIVTEAQMIPSGVQSPCA